MNMNSLLVHFHEYFDAMLMNLIEYGKTDTSRRGMSDLFAELAMDCELYEKYLDVFGDKDQMDEKVIGVLLKATV